MQQVVLDYETRSCVDLTLTGSIEYAKHESTSIFCLGYKIDDQPSKLWIPERARMPVDLWQAFSNAKLIAHNASFERAITKYTLPRYLKGYYVSKIEPQTVEDYFDLQFINSIPASRWKCTAAKAAAASLPRNLEMACKVLGLPVQKDMEGNRLMKKYMKPRKPSKKNPKTWWDDKKELRHIYRYCLVDLEAEYLLDKALPDLSKYEQRIWELDQNINDRGVLIDIPLVKTILTLIEEELKNVDKYVCRLSKDTIRSATQRAKVLEWVNARGANLSDLRANTLEEYLQTDRVPPMVREMLEYRQHTSKTSTAKYQAMVEAVGDDHRARELLLYAGAAVTNRWAGKRIQPQNFPRGHLKYEEVLKVIELLNGH